MKEAQNMLGFSCIFYNKMRLLLFSISPSAAVER